MVRRPPRSNRTATLFPYTTLFRAHSLLAAQLTTRLNRDLGASLSLRSVFDCPTVARLAEIIGQEGDGATPRPKIVRREDQGRAPLSLVQERLRMLEAFNPGTLSYNTPSGHRLRGPLDVALLDRDRKSTRLTSSH